MRKETIIDVHGTPRVLEIRGLTSNEIKRLRDKGFTSFGPRLTLDNADEAIDCALATIATDADVEFLGECENKYTRNVWKALVKETWGDPDEEKNSDATTGGTLTDGE